MLSNKMAKILIFLGALVIIGSFALWQVSWLGGWEDSEEIAKGVKIGGHDVSGYDVESAVQMLEIQLKNELSSKNVEISYEGIKASFNAASFAKLDFESSLEAAYSIGRSGDKTQDYFDLLKAKLSGLELNPKITFDISALENELKAIESLYNIAAKDASIASFDPNAEGEQMLTIVSQENGRELDISETAENIKQAVVYGKDSAQAVVIETEAKITDDVLHGLTLNPVISEYIVGSMTAEYENALYQAAGSERHQILLPGDELSVIEFMGGKEYITSQMPEGGSGSDYEKILTQIFPTQIYIAAILSELEVTEREIYDAYEDNIPTGTSCITDRSHDLKIKNNLSYPIIIRIGYTKKASSTQLFCEIYRTTMENKTYIKSVIRTKENKTFIDILRVYADNKGNTIDTVVAETIDLG